MLDTAIQMAKTPSSSKSESVTLRIPNEIFAQVVDHANAHTRGNRSEAIVALLELGLAVAQNQQSPTGLTVQDSARQEELSETISALTTQVSHLNSLVQDSVMQRLTKVEDGLRLGVFRLRDEAKSLRQQEKQLPDLEAVRDRILSELRVGKQAPEYKRTKAAIDKFIVQMRSQAQDKQNGR